MTDRKVLRAVFATDPARVINMAALETADDPTPGIQGRQRLLFELRQGKYSTCRMRRVCVVGGSLLSLPVPLLPLPPSSFVACVHRYANRGPFLTSSSL